MWREKVSILIFTDLDGTLLDPISYDWDKAKPALDICRKHHIPIIMVSSKTRAELNIIRKEMDLPFPFISENGGGIFFPKESFDKGPPGSVSDENMWKWSMGTPYNQLVKSLKEIGKELGLKLRGFSDMNLEEISGLTGLDQDLSSLAAIREFDEPFIVIDQDDIDSEIISVAAKKRGLQISRGGRFYHIHGGSDKGDAVKKIISWYRQSQEEVFTVALGDSQNDFSMFEQVDQPVLIPSQQDFSGTIKDIPGIIITHDPGPEGWNTAVKGILLDKKVLGGIS
jgi:mannosyl-3-phosphoglycerate phosphatase